MDPKDTSGKTPAEQLEADMVGAKPVKRVETPVQPATGGPQHKSASAEALAAQAADAPKPVTKKTFTNPDLSWVKWFERVWLAVLATLIALVAGWIAKTDEAVIVERVFARVQAMSAAPVKAVTPALVQKKNKPAEVKALVETSNSDLVVEPDTGTAME